MRSANDRASADERTPGWRAACGFFAGLALIALVAWALRRATEPPAARAADAPADVFSAARASAAYTRVFTGADGREVPHPTGSVAADDVRTRLLAELVALGLTPVVEEHLVLRGGTFARVRNVVVPPRVRTERGAILLAAHYDSVAAGPGAGDDAAGVVALLEVARALRSAPPDTQHPVMFLFDDGEELGLLGAQAFVGESAWRGDVGVVVNLEARGTCGPSRMFETSAGNAELITFLAASSARPSANSLAYEIYKRMPNDTDLTVFKRAGLPGFNFAFVGGGRRYHTALDDLAHLDPRTLQHHGDNALALVRTLAAHTGTFAPADGDAVYTDLGGRAFVAWPARFALPVALAPFLALVWIAWRSRRTHGVTFGLFGRGALLTVASVCAAGAAAWLLDACVASAHGGVYPWPPGSSAAHASVVCAAAACVVFAAAFLLTRRERAPELDASTGLHADAALGAWLGWALFPATIGVVLALTLAGATPPFVLPSAACALVLAAARIRVSATTHASVMRATLVAVLLAAAHAALLVPLAQGIEEVAEFRTQDTRTVVLFAALWALVLAPLAAVFTSASRRAAMCVALALAVASGGALVCVLVTPAATADEPQPIFLAHVEREGESEARFYLRRFGAELPPEWPATAAFDGARENPFPWWFRSAEAELARAPIGTALGRANWEIVARSDARTDPSADAPRRVRLRLASPARARHLVLELPRGVALVRASATVNGALRELAADVRGPRALDLVGFATDPVELELELTAAEPVRAELLEVRSAEHGPLRAWAETRPAEFAPRGEGDLAIGACFVTL